MVHHGEALRSVTDKDDLLVYHMQHEPLRAELDAQDRTMLHYAVKLNAAPAAIRAADVEALREAGFDDRAVVDIVLVVAKYNFMNRLANGLGVETSKGFLKAKQRADERVEATLRPVPPPAPDA